MKAQSAGAENDARLERFMGTLKKECLHHFIFASEAHLRRTVAELVRHRRGADG